MRQQEVPYHLGIDVNSQRVLARGPIDLMRNIMMAVDARWHEADYPYLSLPHSRSTYLVLEAAAAPDLVTDEYKRWRSAAMSPTPDIMAVVDQCLDILGMRDKVMQHQKEGLAHTIRSRGIINASEPGTGKTLTNLLAAYVWELDHVLVVCPKSVIPEWDDQHERWFSHLPEEYRFNVWTMDGVNMGVRDMGIRLLLEEPGRHIIVINYESVARFKDNLAKFVAGPKGGVILDESQHVKNKDAMVTKAMMEVCEGAGRVILATGTPIGNDIGDLWSQTKMINPYVLHQEFKDYVGAFGIWVDQLNAEGKPIFSKGKVAKKIVGCRDPANLMRLLDPIWFRAPKAILNLPEKYPPRRVVLQLKPETRKLYDEVVKDGELALGNELGLNGQVVVALRLQQIAGGHAAMYSVDPNDPFMPPSVDLEEMPCIKVAWLEQWAKDHLLQEPTARAIIWCRFNSEVYRVHKMLAEVLGENRAAFANGTVSNEKLGPIKQSFNSRHPEGVQAMVCQIDKMHAGHNLQACDYNIYFSPTWSYIKRAQSEDRSHRLGRSSGVAYIDLVAKDTIDEQVIAALDRKKDLALRLAPPTVSTSGVIIDDDAAVSAETLLEETNCYAT